MTRRILIADTAQAIAELEGALEDQDVEVVHACSFDEAVAKSREQRPQLYVVGYHFDHGRPYRLIDHIRAEDEDAPIVVIRALPLLAASGNEDDIRASYRSLGVDAYLALHEDFANGGRAAALRRFADEIRRSLTGA